MSDWLKADAAKNIEPIAVTFEVSQPPMSWLKAVALANIPFIAVTLPVFQLPMFWLKAVAPLNILPILVTPDTFQLFIEALGEPLKAAHRMNILSAPEAEEKLGASE